MTAATAWLLDASIYVFRAWFGMPDAWRDNNERPLNAAIGFTNTLLGLLEQISPGDPFFAAFDESLGTNFRNEIYSGYKMNRAQADPELVFQFETCKELLLKLGIPSFSGPRYEADDYIATLSALYHQAGYKIRIITRDKDLSQLIVGNEITCFDPISGKVTDESTFKKEYLISPSQLPDLIGLVGDSVDDIPGVAGIGKKIAATLLCEYKSLEGLQERISRDFQLEMRGGRRIKKLLKENWDKALMSRELARLCKSIPEIRLEQTPSRSAVNFKVLESLLIGWNAPNSLLVRCGKLANT